MQQAHKLTTLLQSLRLPVISAHWQTDAKLARQEHWSYEQYLYSLLDKESCTRQQRKIERHIKDSGLLLGKTLDRFEFNEATKPHAGHIKALSENSSWVSSAQNLLLFGASGIGKTHLACAIGYRLLELGFRVKFFKTTELVQWLQQARSELKMAQALDKLARFDVLILDDLSYVKKLEAETSVLFELIADRYESGSLIITSNQAFDQWDQIFPDSMMTVAAIDRLVHHATIIHINGQSYRKMESFKALIAQQESVT